MRSGVVAVVVVVALGYVGVKTLGIYTDRNNLAGKVEKQLERVNVPEDAGVKNALVEEAGKLGVALKPSDIKITFEDASEVQSLAQKIVGKTGAQFQNKRVTIDVHYRASLLGIGLEQQIHRTGMRQISVTAPNRAAPEF
jgi:hypothetical protein